MKNTIQVLRKLILYIIFLQLVNLSVCSEAYWDDYDYAYSKSSPCDPTETIVEWLVEMKYGQQSAFSYDSGLETKIFAKNFHWQTDLQRSIPTVINNSPAKKLGDPHVSRKLALPALEIISPPPEQLKSLFA
jgi:hypothetical protein